MGLRGSSTVFDYSKNYNPPATHKREATMLGGAGHPVMKSSRGYPGLISKGDSVTVVAGFRVKVGA